LHAEHLQKKGMGRENKSVDGIKSAARNCWVDAWGLEFG
jgi:hypothetical protein